MLSRPDRANAMISEVSDSPPIDSESPSPEVIAHVPKGLAAIPDSIDCPPEAPKPPVFQRIALSFGLFFIHLVTWTIQFCNWVLKHIFGLSSYQKRLYNELHFIAKRGEFEKVERFLKEHAEEECAAGFLFSEFLALPELYPHLPQILQGANVCLSQDNGFFCQRWKDHPESSRRPSSHEYQNQECYAIGHFLFWLDPKGNTRFQFEKSPFRGFSSTLNHIIDYLRYKRDNEQQGVAGASSYTEHHCLSCPVNPKAFLIRKADYLTGEPPPDLFDLLQR